jgi:NTE family protein
MSRALVLGGGGLAGIAWELAVVLTLREAGVDVTDADLVVGTSAGSVVGAVAMSDVDLRTLHDEQIDGEDDHEIAAQFDVMEFATTIAKLLSGVSGPDEAIARIAKASLETVTVPESTRRDVIAHRLPVKDWPEGHLILTAIEAENGEFVTFDKDSGVELVDAVAASCAVPLVWPPMTVNGKRYVDGGLRSTTNADLAAGHDKVLVIAPFKPIESPMSRSIAHEVAAIEDKGGAAYVLDADADSLAAFGMNPLDTSTRRPSALAGTAQAQRMLDDVRRFWEG